MARIYAGILGLLAFATVVARGVAQQNSPNPTIWQACGMLFVFAAVGYLIGGTARFIVDDSVRGQLAGQMADKIAPEPGK